MHIDEMIFAHSTGRFFCLKTAIVNNLIYPLKRWDKTSIDFTKIPDPGIDCSNETQRKKSLVQSRLKNGG